MRGMGRLCIGPCVSGDAFETLRSARFEVPRGVPARVDEGGVEAARPCHVAEFIEALADGCLIRSGVEGVYERPLRGPQVSGFLHQPEDAFALDGPAAGVDPECPVENQAETHFGAARSPCRHSMHPSG